MALEDKLIGQNLVVEAQLYGGSENKVVQTFRGTYSGTDTFLNEEVLLLKNAAYAGREYCGGQEYSKTVALLAIPARHILSIGTTGPAKVDSEGRQ